MGPLTTMLVLLVITCITNCIFCSANLLPNNPPQYNPLPPNTPQYNPPPPNPPQYNPHQPARNLPPQTPPQTQNLPPYSPHPPQSPPHQTPPQYNPPPQHAQGYCDPKTPPKCSTKTELPYCIVDEDYPAYDIAQKISQDSLFLKKYADKANQSADDLIEGITKATEESFDYSFYTGASEGNSPYDSTNWIGPEGTLCPSETVYVKITRAVNVEGYWRIILQHIPEGYGYGHYNYTTIQPAPTKCTTIQSSSTSKKSSSTNTTSTSNTESPPIFNPSSPITSTPNPTAVQPTATACPGLL